MAEEKTTVQKNPQDLKANEKKGILGEAQDKKNRKKFILPILMVLVLAACGAAYYYVSLGNRYFTTDNAKVTAKMYTITPVMSGELLEWHAQEGEKVAKDQILGRQGVLPYIVSPINGTIVKNYGIEGQIVSAAAQLAVVADTDNLYIGVNIEETDIMKIRVGQRVDVKIDAYAGKTFQGSVSEIDRTTQTYFSSTSSFSTSGTYTKVTQLVPVKVVIANEENLPLTFGMNATVKIHIKDQAAGGPEDQKPPAEQPITAGSAMEAAKMIGVRPDISGKVRRIDVEVGQSVKEGDVLFVLDSTELELQVRQAEASYRAALSSYQNSKSTYDSQNNILPLQTAHDEAAASYERLKTLFEANAISQVELDNAKDKVATSLAQLESAKASAKTALDAARAQMETSAAALAIVREKLQDCVVKAPMTGLVATKAIEVGDLASTQAAAMTLVDTQRMVIRIKVSETNISRVETGNEAEVTVQAIGMVTKGAVTSVSPAADPVTGMFPVEIQVENPEGKLKVGMMADVKLP